MRHSDSLKAIAPALVACLGEIESVSKDASNPAFKRDGKALRYTTLDAVIEASRAVLTKHDLALMQFPGALDSGALTLETVIMHKSGEWVSGDFQIALGKSDPQGVGSALTYARRYAQKAALNIADDDDDANGASRREDDRRDERRDERPKDSQVVAAAKLAIDGCYDTGDLKRWLAANRAELDKIPTADFDKIVDYYNAAKAKAPAPKQDTRQMENA